LCKIYKFLEIANLLKWHHYNQSERIKMETVVDNPAWYYIDKAIDKDFAKEKKNLRLGLSLDGG
jgi:hypothetical protein